MQSLSNIPVNTTSMFKSFRAPYTNSLFEQNRDDFKLYINQLLVKQMKKQGLLSKNKEQRKLEEMLYASLDSNSKINFNYEDKD